MRKKKASHTAGLSEILRCGGLYSEQQAWFCQTDYGYKCNLVTIPGEWFEIILQAEETRRKPGL